MATEPRATVAAIAGQRTTPTFDGHCIYCARPCYGRACNCHKDLLLIEQQMYRGPYRSAA